MRLKPLAAERRRFAFRKCAQNCAGDIVVDLFAGSGSTLIGCERRGRKARLMEIDPKYADCIVCRYQDYTGKQATLDGRSFDEIAQERGQEAA